MNQTQITPQSGGVMDVQDDVAGLKIVCSAPGAFDFKLKERLTTGYILSLKLKDDNLAADWSVTDPETPANPLKVVAILDEVSWSRKRTDPIKFVGRISAGNRKIFEAWVMKQDTGSDISVDWVTKQYDVDAKQYYQRFHSEGKEIKFVRADSPPPTIKAHTETEPTNPPNYKFTLYLTPKSEGGEQTLGFASGADHKMSVPLGITTG